MAEDAKSKVTTMINELHIRGLGVIEQASLEFAEGFTVLTGETGAGKTMILTSLRLLMGAKTDSDVVREGSQQTSVDGLVTIQDEMRSSLEEIGVEDEDGQLIISRMVPTQGRSRAAVGGRPVPARILEEITDQLIKIHGQADQWSVRRPEMQRQILDEYGDEKHQKKYRDYREHWYAAVAAKKHLDEIESARDRREVEVRYLEETCSRIENLQIDPVADKVIDEEINRLANAEDLQEDFQRIVFTIEGNEDANGIRDHFSKILDCLRSRESFIPHGSGWLERLEAIDREVSVLSEEFRDLLDNLVADPHELERLLQRRADLEELMRGRANSIEELVRWYEDAKDRLSELQSVFNNPEVAAEQLAMHQQEVLTFGKKLTKSRQTLAGELTKAVGGELAGLGMSTATFTVHVTEDTPHSQGADTVTMTLQSHPDAPARKLGEGASGGELSRVMLSLEVSLGTRRPHPITFVFDEVDAGIGGRTATEVGRRLAQLAAHQQVIVVTHLPQVAAFASCHMVVEKDNGLTTVRTLHGENRVDEIVRMLGGEKDSSAARRHAVELLAANSMEESPT